MGSLVKRPVQVSLFFSPCTCGIGKPKLQVRGTQQHQQHGRSPASCGQTTYLTPTKMDSNHENTAEERMLNADFANDDLESVGYHRSESALLLPLGHFRDQRSDIATHDALVVRRESRDELYYPQLDLLHEPAAAPQQPPSREQSEWAPLKQTNNFSINVNVDGGGPRARKKTKRSKSHHDDAVDQSRPGKEAREQTGGRRGELDGWLHCRRVCIFSTIAIVLVAFAAVVCTVLVPAAGGDARYEPGTIEPRQPMPPSPIADFLAKLEYDVRQLERRHERAVARLPAGAHLRGVLTGSTQPHLLRHEVTRLQDLRARLLGEGYESNIIYYMRSSEVRLREIRERAGGPTSMDAWLRAVAPRWLRSRIAGEDLQAAEVLRAERNRVTGMEQEVRKIIAGISEVRDAALRACQSRPRQNAHGGWVLGDSSVCRRDEGGWELPGQVGMESPEVESDAKTALGFINWICQDLDDITLVVDDHGAVYQGLDSDQQGPHDAHVQSLAAEAARIMEKWQYLGSQWEELGHVL